MKKELLVGAIILAVVGVGGWWVLKEKPVTDERVQLQGQSVETDTMVTPKLTVLEVRNNQDIVVSYKNIPAEAKSLFLCIPGAGCTEWGVPFSPKDAEGVFVMTRGEGSTKQVGPGTFVVSATADPFKVLFSSEPFTN